MKKKVIIIAAVCVLAVVCVLVIYMMQNRSEDDEGNKDESQYNVGEIIELGGHYWVILDIKDGAALLLSEQVLFQRAYNTGAFARWEDSDIRQYLNGEFFVDTFTEDERERILETVVDNSVFSVWVNQLVHSETTDRVFMLSLNEVVQYFGDSGQNAERELNSVEYDDAEGRVITTNTTSDIFINDEYNSNRIVSLITTGANTWWWLRTSGESLFNPGNMRISTSGVIELNGVSVDLRGGVRPALWLKLE
jgi:hypothetical protein